MEPFQRTLVAAQGYCELSMYREALAELATLPDEVQREAVVVEMHLVTYLQAKQWPAAIECGRLLCELRPEAHSGYIHTAFSLHELGRTAEAREHLLSGPATLKSEANYYYNLACYECVLGHVEEGAKLLKQSFVLDAKYKEFAKTDPDLQALKEKEKRS